MKKIFLIFALVIAITGCSRNRIAIKESIPNVSLDKKTNSNNSSFAEINKIIERTHKLFTEGENNLKGGHLIKAKENFDEAVMNLLDAKEKYPDDLTIAKELENIIESIHNYEMDTIEEGDAFAEENNEPALIDKLKDIPFFPPTKEILQKEEQVKAEAAEQNFDIPIVINDKVLALIEAFQNERRYEFERGLNRAGLYMNLIRNILEQQGLPKDLVYAALVESGFNPKAYSVARAKGIWQFIEGTAKKYGLKINWWVDERSDAVKSTIAAAAYLKDLYNMFGDWYLALAAYNAGERKVLNAINKTGKKDFWELIKTPYLKEQTKNYVPAILAAAIISKNPDKFGFQPIQFDPIEYEEIEINKFMDLRTIADICDCRLEELQKLNPELRRNIVPGSFEKYLLKVPKNKKEIIASKIEQLPTYRISNLRRYVVQKNDTLYKIAKKYNISPLQLAEANNINIGKPLKKGTVLIIPSSKTYYSYARKIQENKINSNAYIVQPGDTLYSLSIKFDIEIDELKRINSLKSNLINPGQRLIVSSQKKKPDKKPILYTVKRGDTLLEISRKHGVSIEKICSWNNIDANRTLHPGQRLTIFVGAME